MKDLFSKSLLKYVVGVFLIVGLTGGVLSLLVTNYIFLISILIIQFFAFIFLLLFIFDKYIKPIEKMTNAISELTEGNYRKRIHHRTNGTVAALMTQINTLARKLNEMSIHEEMQAEQLMTIVDNTESGLVLLDEKGYIHLVNRKFISMFGKSYDRYVGHLFYEAIDNEKIHEIIQRTFLYEEQVKDSLSQPMGQKKNHLEVISAPIFNDHQTFKGTLLVLYDVTEFKNVELMRKDFVANVSHELKTPITSIKGFSETLLEGAMHNEESLQKFLTIIYDESERLRLLIDDLLTLSRLEQEELDLSFSNVNMDHLLNEVVSLIQFHADQNRIVFEKKIEKSLTITGDYKKIKQVFINLLTNAVNYTGENGKVLLEVMAAGDYVKINVTDTGIGIEPQHITRIFERFYRIDRDRSRKTGGTGLGLAITRHIVESHEGKIEVESELHKGSTFTVYLPIEIKEKNIPQNKAEHLFVKSPS